MLYTTRDLLDLDWEVVHRLVDEGYISRQPLAGTDLAIYNYTQKTQWDRHWTPETLACRGLIVGERGVVARPFPKFFGLEQIIDTALVPSEPFEVFEKLDGSLGILYWVDDTPRIATRGSFVSEQAEAGTAMLQGHDLTPFDPSVTYLFEIIYRDNRIVVDYGDRSDLVLLAAIDTATGEELPLPSTDFPVAKRYDFRDMDAILEWAEPNTEGFVIRFASGIRLKVKTAEYKRLHRLVTGVNAKTIWEILSAGQSLDAVVDRVPDEFYAWVRQIEAQLQDQFSAIEERCRIDFRRLDSRKETALYFQTCRYPAVLFRMLDDKPSADIIWKMIRPAADKPFRMDEP